MMRHFLLLVLVLGVFSFEETPAQSISVQKLRNDLPSILASQNSIEHYIQLLEKEHHPTSVAYRGLLKTTMAQFVFWPFRKLSYFNEGKKDIETAILKSTDSVEVRFIRLLVQCNAPGFLDYSSNIQDDVGFVLSRISLTGPESYISKMIVEHLLKQNKIDIQSKAALSALKKSLS